MIQPMIVHQSSSLKAMGVSSLRDIYYLSTFRLPSMGALHADGVLEPETMVLVLITKSPQF
jgi:hypothetical protein